MLEFYKKNKALIVFLMRAAGIYLIWFIVYKGWLYKDGTIDHFLINHLIRITSFVLKTIGYTVFNEGHLIGIVNSTGLIVSTSCDGFSLFMLFAGFIMAYPGNVRSKFIFIPIGLLIIDLLNIVRIITLVIIVKYSPKWLEFNHSYTFTLIMYLLIFFMWMVWIRNGTKGRGTRGE